VIGQLTPGRVQDIVRGLALVFGCDRPAAL
jgi:hypothetical protein